MTTKWLALTAVLEPGVVTTKWLIHNRSVGAGYRDNQVGAKREDGKSP